MHFEKARATEASWMFNFIFRSSALPVRCLASATKPVCRLRREKEKIGTQKIWKAVERSSTSQNVLYIQEKYGDSRKRIQEHPMYSETLPATRPKVAGQILQILAQRDKPSPAWSRRPNFVRGSKSKSEVLSRTSLVRRLLGAYNLLAELANCVHPLKERP